MVREMVPIPDWFREYMEWLAEKPRSMGAAWLKLSDYGDEYGEDAYSYLEISWPEDEITEERYA